MLCGTMEESYEDIPSPISSKSNDVHSMIFIGVKPDAGRSKEVNTQVLSLLSVLCGTMEKSYEHIRISHIEQISSSQATPMAWTKQYLKRGTKVFLGK